MIRKQRRSKAKLQQKRKLPVCPCCGHRKSLETAYSVSDGGSVPDANPWAGQAICGGCIGFLTPKRKRGKS